MKFALVGSELAKAVFVHGLIKQEDLVTPRVELLHERRLGEIGSGPANLGEEEDLERAMSVAERAESRVQPRLT